MIKLPTVSYAGRYRLRKIRAGRVTLDTGWFDNLITDGGLDQFASIPLGTGGIPYLITQAFVGTGTTAPANTDNQLDVYLGASDILESSGTNAYIAGPPPFWRHVRIFTFAPGTVTGLLTEVGVGNTNTTLFSRALLVDAANNTNAVEVLPDEGIQLAYELRSYVSTEDLIMSATFQGNTTGSDVFHSFVARPAQINIAKPINIGMGYTKNNIALYSGVIQTVTGSPEGTGTSLSAYSPIEPYVSGSHTISFSYTFSTTVGNYPAGIKSLRFSNSQFDFQASVSPPILKSADYMLILSASFSWGRYTP